MTDVYVTLRPPCLCPSEGHCDVGPENSLDDRNGKTKTNNTENNKD